MTKPEQQLQDNVSKHFELPSVGKYAKAPSACTLDDLDRILPAVLPRQEKAKNSPPCLGAIFKFVVPSISYRREASKTATRQDSPLKQHEPSRRGGRFTVNSAC